MRLSTLGVLFSLLLVGCPPVLSGDDDDATGGGDDDDATSSACDPALQATLNDLANWTLAYSCSAASFTAGPADQSVRLHFSWLLPEPLSDGDSWSLIYDGESKNAVEGAAELQTGQFLMAYDCNDAVEQKPLVETVLAPVGGEAWITITEYNDEYWWRGDVRINGFEFINAGGGVCTVPNHIWENESFGWLPG